jgi:hypothetical protein
VAWGRIALRRDHLIAASLASAVVVVVGYASGIGLRPGGVAVAEPPPAGTGLPATPAGPSGEQGVPSNQMPSMGPLPPLTTGSPPPGSIPAGTPGDVAAAPVVGTPPDPGTAPPSIDPPSTDSPSPPSSTPVPPLPPPGTELPACQPGVTQQVLDTVGGVPLLGSLTTGLGVTGPDGVGAMVLGYCRTQDGASQPALVPAPDAAAGLLGGG